jgi:peptidyl-prolyl cis-trans isomerase D
MQGKTVDAEYVVAGFNSIPDTDITITNKDLKSYYKKHINNYKQEESRDIRFAYFEILPSEEDYKLAEENLNSLISDFANAGDARLFVSQESDLPPDIRNYAEGEIVPDTLNDFMFSAKVGDTFGPYFYENSYRVSRLAEINFLPDSARARHILLQVTASNQATILETADSLKNLIKEGVSFVLLAMTNSMDNSAQAGGDLGWFREGTMVQTFNDSVFYGRKGDLKTVITDYGVHIVEITDQSRPVKKIKVATLVKNVVPGDKTDQEYYAKANEFAGMHDNYDSFIEAVNDSSFTGNSQPVPNLAPMDKSLPGIQNARQLVIWAYQAEPGDVSSVLKFDNKYVVGTVEKVREKGFIPMDEILTELEIAVRKEKKAALLAEKMAGAASGASSLEPIATTFETQVQSVTALNYSSDIFGTSGIDPAPVAAALTLQSGVISAPVVGENGVYVIKVNKVDDVALGEISLTKQSLKNTYGALVSYYSYGALEKLAGVVDNRREFF